MFEISIETSNGKPVDKVRCMINKCSMGKSRDNLVQLRGWKMAQIHAEIEQNPDGLYVRDVSNGGGIKVNGQSTELHGPLTEKDKISIGSYVISVLAEEIKEDVPVLNESTTESNSVKAPEASEEAQRALNKEYIQWRMQIHSELLTMMDIRRTDVGDMDDTELRKSVLQYIEQIIDGMASAIPPHILKEKLSLDVLNEAVGLGPLEELLAQDDVTEIMVNSFDDIYIEKSGKLIHSGVSFSDDHAVLSAIERIVSPLGRRIDESSPMVDARLKDGSRVNAIIPPLALRGPCITIRKFAKEKLTGIDLVNFNSVSHNMIDFLQTAVEERCNIVISGGTGSGKTTLLNVMSNFIPHEERVVTVEDAAELKLSMPHIVSLESRPPNLEGKGAVPIRDLVKNCLRMRPDRIVVGECRGGEALDMLQAMNTGHDGSLTTAHANTPRDVISRLEVMVMMAGMDLPASAIREQIGSAVDIVVQQTRFADGSRKITHISEITGVESGKISLQDIFLYKQTGYDDNGKVVGKFVATGLVPYFYETLRERGIKVNMNLFAIEA
ncbi:MAG: Flp pilus assembly complex ATPase component [Gammaproteobacteria bacterium]|nr:Flp pilus assembly complex ATPase component [Gammaproteobacteria bacterium]